LADDLGAPTGSYACTMTYQYYTEAVQLMAFR
jgi:hypothetical protein